MTDLEPFRLHILKRVSLSPEELDALVGAFAIKKIKKKQFIIQPEFTARYRTYVLQGSFRSYVIDGMNSIFESVTPMKRQGTADETAKGFLFLASDDSSYMTGGELLLDGGFANL